MEPHLSKISWGHWMTFNLRSLIGWTTGRSSKSPSSLFLVLWFLYLFSNVLLTYEYSQEQRRLYLLESKKLHSQSNSHLTFEQWLGLFEYTFLFLVDSCTLDMENSKTESGLDECHQKFGTRHTARFFKKFPFGFFMSLRNWTDRRNISSSTGSVMWLNSWSWKEWSFSIKSS